MLNKGGNNKLNRDCAVRGAMRSLEIEGFTFTKDEKSDFDNLATGKISHLDMLKKIDNNYQKLKKENPKAFLDNYFKE